MGKTEQQTTRSVFVIRIILDDFSCLCRLAYFAHQDIAQECLVCRVLGKLEGILGELLANFMDERHIGF